MGAVGHSGWPRRIPRAVRGRALTARRTPRRQSRRQDRPGRAASAHRRLAPSPPGQPPGQPPGPRGGGGGGGVEVEAAEEREERRPAWRLAPARAPRGRSHRPAQLAGRHAPA
jgi:hypothetical protein